MVLRVKVILVNEDFDRKGKEFSSLFSAFNYIIVLEHDGYTVDSIELSDQRLNIIDIKEAFQKDM